MAAKKQLIGNILVKEKKIGMQNFCEDRQLSSLRTIWEIYGHEVVFERGWGKKAGDELLVVIRPWANRYICLRYFTDDSWRWTASLDKYDVSAEEVFSWIAETIYEQIS